MRRALTIFPLLLAACMTGGEPTGFSLKGTWRNTSQEFYHKDTGLTTVESLPESTAYYYQFDGQGSLVGVATEDWKPTIYTYYGYSFERDTIRISPDSVRQASGAMLYWSDDVHSFIPARGAPSADVFNLACLHVDDHLFKVPFFSIRDVWSKVSEEISLGSGG